MGLFSNLFTKKQVVKSQNPEHAVIVHFSYYQTNGHTDLQPIVELEEKLTKAISSSEVGDYDGNEVAVDGHDGFLYMYGHDGDKLFDVVRPILESASFTKDATVTVRYGPPKDGVKRIDIKLNTNK
jgi:hypothetical protein